MNDKTYTAVWRKYLDLIRFFLKKDLRNEQSFPVNKIDFNVGNRVKSGYSFTLYVNNGKAENVPCGSVVGDNLYELLESDVNCKKLLTGKRLRIKMSDDYHVSIKEIK